MVEPQAVTTLGVELAARIASPPGAQVRRAEYLLIEDGIVLVGAQFDESGLEIHEKGPLDEHPLLSKAVRTWKPVVGRLDPQDVGPALRAVLTDTGITHGAWVPVCPDGTLHGVLSIATRGLAVPPECVDRCVALGHLMELALSNWAAHQELEQQATIEERRRIARELHDGLAHELAFIASKTHRSAEDFDATPDLRELADAADRALDEARRAITVLSAAQPQSLATAVAQTAEDLGERLDLAVHLDLTDDIEIPGDVTENLLRILREAMTNAAKHGESRKVTVSLQREGGIRLVVEDDGCGFDPDGVSPSRGFGLLSMKERAESLGGILNLNSAPSRGTRVEVAVP
jgi:signal transduction histidine kinase